MKEQSTPGGCPFLSGCPFFNENMRAYPVGAEVMKDQFCRGDYARCARYLIATKLGRDKMPSMMFPDQIDRAKKLLHEYNLDASDSSNPQSPSGCLPKGCGQE